MEKEKYEINLHVLSSVMFSRTYYGVKHRDDKRPGIKGQPFGHQASWPKVSWLQSVLAASVLASRVLRSSVLESNI